MATNFSFPGGILKDPQTRTKHQFKMDKVRRRLNTNRETTGQTRFIIDNCQVSRANLAAYIGNFIYIYSHFRVVCRCKRKSPCTYFLEAIDDETCSIASLYQSDLTSSPGDGVSKKLKKVLG